MSAVMTRVIDTLLEAIGCIWRGEHAEKKYLWERYRANHQMSMSGGYIFNNVHNIQPGVLPQNIVVLYNAAYEFGFY